MRFLVLCVVGSSKLTAYSTCTRNKTVVVFGLSVDHEKQIPVRSATWVDLQSGALLNNKGKRDTT